MKRCRAKKHAVTLPNGQSVTVSNSPGEWWYVHGGVGYVHPSLLAPDPKQPRKFMSEVRLAELRESVRARGVRDSIVVTPRRYAPWATVAPEYEHCELLIVSGHRRTSAALMANVEAVPVEVRIYPNEREHRSDVSLLNKGQDPLTELEEGYELLENKKAGWTYEELSEHYGWNALTIRYRLNLTKLEPTIQGLISPGIPERSRLQVTIAQHLGGVHAVDEEELREIARRFDKKLTDKDFASEDARRFALQRILLQVIQARGLTTPRAAALIRDLALEYRKGGRGDFLREQHHVPKKRRDTLDALHKGVNGSVVVDWKPAELERVLGNVSREEADTLVKELERARDVIEGVLRVVRSVSGKKKPTAPEVLRLMTKRTPAGA